MKKMLYIILCLQMISCFIFSSYWIQYGLLLSVIIGTLGLLAVLHSRALIRRTVPNVSFFLFIVTLIILIPFSLAKSHSIENVLWWLSYMAIFITAQCFASDRRLLEIIAKVFAVLATIYSVCMAYLFTVIGLSSYTRLSGLSAGHNIYGAFLILPLFLSGYFAIKEHVIWKKSLWIVATSIILSNIVLTFSRGTWLSIVVGLALFLFVSKGYITWQLIRTTWKTYVLVILIAVISVSGIWFAAKRNTVRTSIEKPAAQVFSNEDADNNAFVSRLHYFGDALATFIQRPIFGFGGGTYPYALRMFKMDPNYGSFADPHNWFLRMLVENGIVVAVIFLAFLGTLFWEMWRMIRRQKQLSWFHSIVFVGLFGSVFHGLMDMDWSYSILLPVFFCFAGALYGSVLDANETKNTTARSYSLWVDVVMLIVLLIAVLASFQLFRADSTRRDGDYLYFTKQRVDVSVESYQASADLNPYDPAPWYSLWNLYMSEEMPADALVAIKKAISIFPKNGTFYGYLATTYEGFGSTTDGIGYHDALVSNIKYFPANSLSTYVKLIKYDFERRNYKEAWDYINRVVPIYSHYETVLWYKNDPNSSVMSENLKILKDYKTKIEEINKSISSSTK